MSCFAEQLEALAFEMHRRSVVAVGSRVRTAAADAGLTPRCAYRRGTYGLPVFDSVLEQGSGCRVYRSAREGHRVIPGERAALIPPRAARFFVYNRSHYRLPFSIQGLGTGNW